jgi:RND superfamily putative drug exporter
MLKALIQPSAGGTDMAEWCLRHARGVVAGWLAVLVIALIAGLALGGERNRANARVPGTDSQTTNDLIQRVFPNQRGDLEAVVVSTPTGTLLSGPAFQSAEILFSQLRAVPGVRSVGDPLVDNSTSSGAVALNHRTAIAVLRFRQDSLDVPDSSVRQVVDDIKASHSSTFTASAMGWAVEDSEVNPPKMTEIVGFLAAVIVLVFALGSAVAGGIALGNALIALGVSSGVLQIASHVLDIPYFGPQVALIVGLGIGIDYGLLTVARYKGARERASRGSQQTVDALRRTSRTVTFAGGTVIVAILGLLLTPISVVRGVTVAVIIAVVPAVLAAVTLLPALLHLADPYLDRGRPPLRRRGKILESSAGWGRWSAAVQRRPVIAMLGSLTILGLLATPLLWLRLAPADGSTDNPTSLTAQAYNTASDAFGPGVTAPLEIVAHTPPGGSIARSVARLRQTLVATPDVFAVTPAVFGTNPHDVLVNVIPATAPDSTETAALLDRIRTTEADRLRSYGIGIGVGGQAAIQLDTAAVIHHWFPLTVLAVIGSSFLLLLMQFRSIAIAAKAGIMNLLSISAAFGITVAIFQWGWGIHLIGIDHAGPLQSFVPLLLFPVLFGLSMDYEVFLMSRISDEWERTNDPATAITNGVAATARVVTSGAAIMFALFAAMALAGSRTVETFGVGLALAVLLDATVIRSLLLPATMQLLGRYNWWIPGWLHRRLPVLRPV